MEKPSRRWTSAFCPLSPFPYLSVFFLTLSSFYACFPRFRRNVFPWWPLRLQMRWLHHPFWEQLLWSGRILSSRDRLLLRYPFLPTPSYFHHVLFLLCLGNISLLFSKTLACSLFRLPRSSFALLLLLSVRTSALQLFTLVRSHENVSGLNFLLSHTADMCQSFYSVEVILTNARVLFRGFKDTWANQFEHFSYFQSLLSSDKGDGSWTGGRIPNRSVIHILKRVMNKPREDKVEDIRPCNPDIFGHGCG